MNALSFIAFTPSMPRSRAHPDPVSCQSCRSKKLKCNRVQPCSSCTTRGLTCNFLVPPKEQPNTQPPSQSNADLLRRIEHLESVVQQQSRSTNASSEKASTESLSPDQAVQFAHQGDTSLSGRTSNRDEDSKLLQSVGTREDSLVR